jgi:tetratricopeptide (TPR) repeat protein
MLQLESEIQRRIGRFVKAMDYIDQAIAMKETIYGKEHPSVAEAMEVKVKIYHHLGEKVDAKVLIDRALEIRLNAYGENHPEVSRSIHDLGSYYLRLGQYEAAVKQFERVRQITATVFGDRHPDYVVDTIDLANALYQQGKYQLALGLVEEVKDALPQGNHYLRARWLQLMSEIQQRQGKFKDALEFIDQAIAMKETIYGKEHPSVAESLEVKVDLMLGQLNHQDSSEVLDTIERIRSKAYSKSHPEYANYLLRRAKWYEIDGRYDDASEVLKQSLQICLNAFSARHPATSRRQIMLARMDRMANRIVGAEDRIKGVCETLGTRLETEDSLIVAETLQELSYIRRAQGDYHAALAELEKALRVEATIFSSESPEVIELQNEKAKLLILFHRLTEAEDIIESALRYVELDQPIYKRLKSNLLGQLGILLVYKKEYDQAIENVEEAIQLKKHLLGAENVELGRLYIEKAWVLRRLSKYNESFATLEATHNIDNLHFDENHIYFARILLEQGQTYLDKKSFWEAQEHLREALQIYDKQLNKNVKQHADAAEALGRSYLETGFLNEATEMFQKAMEIRTAIYGSLHPEIAETLYYQAQALLKMSESRENEDSKTKARQKLEQALNMLGQSSVFNVELVSKIEHTLAAL